MIYFSLLVVILLGFSIINLISDEFSNLEKIGLSFLIGIGFETVFMFIFDLTGIRFTGINLLVISFFAIIGLNAKYILNCKETISSLRAKFHIPEKFDARKVNLIWLVFFLVTITLVYGSVSKSLFWPTSAYDNVAGYDLMGKVMAAEGKIDNSLFEIDNKPILGSAKRIIYPPLVPGSFAFAYLFNNETSKIITSMLLIFFIIAFYAFLRKYTVPTNAVIFTFLMLITPEMFAFTSLSTSNIPFAIYASLGMISFFHWFDKKDNKYLILSSLLITFSSWSRSEGIVFAFIFSSILFYYSYKNKYWINNLLMSLIAFSSFLVWNIYVKIHFEVNQSVFFPYLFWDYDKVAVILKWVKQLVFSTNMYGLTFYLFLLFVAINFIIKINDKKNIKLLFIIISTMGLYTFLFYQMDNSKMDSINSMMKASYRRGIFAFVPLVWYYMSVSSITNKIFIKIELYLVKKKQSIH